MERTNRGILIVDDDEATRRLLKRLLESEHAYRLADVAGGEQAVEILPFFLPDLVMLDIMMPGIDGHETCRRLRSSPFGRGMQIMMLSAQSSREEQARAYEAGADDYVVKPFDANELRSRVRLHFRLRGALDTIALGNAESGPGGCHGKNVDVAVTALLTMAQFRDRETGEHLIRMRSYAQLLAEELGRRGPYAGQCDPQFIEDLYRASPLHDVGKVGISDEILLKPARLTPEQFEAMQQHTVIGANLLERILLEAPWASFLHMAAAVARFHHERFDGNGYPAGLAGSEIPLPARIVALADAFDAITSVRPYKEPLPVADAKQIIEQDAGSHFDPVVVEAFRRRFDAMVSVHQRVQKPLSIVVGANSFAPDQLFTASAAMPQPY